MNFLSPSPECIFSSCRQFLLLFLTSSGYNAQKALFRSFGHISAKVVPAFADRLLIAALIQFLRERKSL